MKIMKNPRHKAQGTTAAYWVNEMMGIIDVDFQIDWDRFHKLKSNDVYKEDLLQNSRDHSNKTISKAGNLIIRTEELNKVVEIKDEIGHYAFDFSDYEHKVILRFCTNEDFRNHQSYDQQAELFTKSKILLKRRSGDNFGKLTDIIDDLPRYTYPQVSIIG